MFTLNDDLSIYATRGDIVFFAVSAEDDGYPYRFHAGDVVRFKVYEKKNANNVVLQKDFPVTDTRTEVAITLDRADTKIGDVISKHKDYWYSVTLNDDTNPQTIIGYDEDGPKLFRLFPEGADIPPYEPIQPEDIPIVDDKLDLTSHRPIENQAVAREIVALQADYNATKETVLTATDNTAEAIAVERSRIDNLIAHDDAIVNQALEYALGTSDKYDATITSDGVYATIKVNLREANLFIAGGTHPAFVIPNECRPIDVGRLHTEYGMAFDINFDNESNRYVLAMGAAVEGEYAPTQACVVTLTYALADYELKDIRVGADGATYATAGEAVRKQIDGMQDRFICGTRNLFDKDAVTVGHYINPASGKLEQNSGFCASDFIPVTVGKTYTVKLISNAAFFKSDKTYLKGAGASATFVVPDDACYFRCSVPVGEVDAFNMNEGSSLFPYSAYGTTFLTIDPFSDELLRELKKRMGAGDNNANVANYFDKVAKHLANPFVKTQIKLVGDSITAGMGGTGFSETGEQIPNSIKANNLEATCWSNMLYHYVNDNFNRDAEVVMDNENIKYNATYAIDTYDTKINGVAVYGRYAILLNNKIQKNAVEFSFYGDHFSIYYEKGTDRGIFEVYVDDELKATVDCYDSTASKRNELRVDGLTVGNHTVNIAMTNTKNEASTLGQIRLTGFVVPKTAVVKPWGVSGTTSNVATVSSRYSDEDDFVIMQYGTNDRHTLFSPEQTYRNLVAGVNLIKESFGADVILMCSCPSNKAYESSDSVIRYFHMWDVKNAVAKAAGHFSMPYIDNYDAFLRYAETHNLTIDDLLADGLHPNDLGHKVMYENIMRSLGLALLPDYK